MKSFLKLIAIFTILVSLQSCIVSEKSLYNEETKGNATVTKINVPMFIVKPYIKKALREDGESEEVIRLIKKIRKVKVYTVQNASDKMVAQFSRQSFGSNLQELMSVNSKDSKIKIMFVGKETKYQPSNKQVQNLSKEATDWIKSILPNVNIDLQQDLIDGIANGSFNTVNELITLSEKYANKKTAKHEVFHLAFNRLSKQKQDELLNEGKATVQVLKSLDKWYGVTYKEDKPVVVAAIQSLKDSGLYPEKLWEEK